MTTEARAQLLREMGFDLEEITDEELVAFMEGSLALARVDALLAFQPIKQEAIAIMGARLFWVMGRMFWLAERAGAARRWLRRAR